MSVQLLWYAKARANAYAGKIDFLGHDMRVALLGPGYVPNRDVDETWGDVSGFEVTGPGYDAGGRSLVNKTVTYDAGLKRTALDADDTEWASASISGRTVVIYDNTHPSKPLLGFADHGVAGFSCTNGRLTAHFSSNGILTDTLNP